MRRGFRSQDERFYQGAGYGAGRRLGVCKNSAYALGQSAPLSAVARSGSLSGAGRCLGVNPATVSRHIEQLEQELETRLFLREPSGYVRTSAGERLMARVEALEQEALACQETVADETTVAGPAVITARRSSQAILFCG